MTVEAAHIPIWKGSQAMSSVESSPTHQEYDFMKMVATFMEKFGVCGYFNEKDAYGKHRNLTASMRVLDEEYRELVDELLDFDNGEGSVLRLAKELADVAYVVFQIAAIFEVPLNEVFKLVHESNLTKLDSDGKPVVRSDGKILKGSKYKEPDLTALFYGDSEV